MTLTALAAVALVAMAQDRGVMIDDSETFAVSLYSDTMRDLVDVPLQLRSSTGSGTYPVRTDHMGDTPHVPLRLDRDIVITIFEQILSLDSQPAKVLGSKFAWNRNDASPGLDGKIFEASSITLAYVTPVARLVHFDQADLAQNDGQSFRWWAFSDESSTYNFRCFVGILSGREAIESYLNYHDLTPPVPAEMGLVFLPVDGEASIGDSFEKGMLLEIDVEGFDRLRKFPRIHTLYMGQDTRQNGMKAKRIDVIERTDRPHEGKDTIVKVALHGSFFDGPNLLLLSPPKEKPVPPLSEDLYAPGNPPVWHDEREDLTDDGSVKEKKYPKDPDCLPREPTAACDPTNGCEPPEPPAEDGCPVEPSSAREGQKWEKIGKKICSPHGAKRTEVLTQTWGGGLTVGVKIPMKGLELSISATGQISGTVSTTITVDGGWCAQSWQCFWQKVQEWEIHRWDDQLGCYVTGKEETQCWDIGQSTGTSCQD